MMTLWWYWLKTSKTVDCSAFSWCRCHWQSSKFESWNQQFNRLGPLMAMSRTCKSNAWSDFLSLFLHAQLCKWSTAGRWICKDDRISITMNRALCTKSFWESQLWIVELAGRSQSDYSTCVRADCICRLICVSWKPLSDLMCHTLYPIAHHKMFSRCWARLRQVHYLQICTWSRV